MRLDQSRCNTRYRPMSSQQVPVADPHEKPLRPNKGALAVGAWLLVIALMVYGMILVGGATRLTDSGLSITEWKPVTGALPPLSDADWASEFDKYRAQTAEYRLQNKGMSLNEFQSIYWWEWGHRLLGRLIGMVFLIPFIVFWAMGWTTSRLRKRLWVLFALGGLQGAVGWWMVASGVGDTDRIDVAPYRLMIHFSLALLIIGGCFWTWLSISRIPRAIEDRRGQRWAVLLLALISLQMMLGALVAGLDAGRTYTDWPMMGGDVIPDAFWIADLGLRNVVENPATAQFNHRIAAYLILVLSLFAGWRYPKAAGGWFKWMSMLAVGQSLLGIATLIHAAPLHLGLMHQALGALLFLASVIVLWRTSAQGEALASSADTGSASQA